VLGFVRKRPVNSGCRLCLELLLRVAVARTRKETFLRGFVDFLQSRREAKILTRKSKWPLPNRASANRQRNLEVTKWVLGQMTNGHRSTMS
jgi:hypothetical protein